MAAAYHRLMTRWTMADAWVFSALAGSGPDAVSLSQLIANADLINHAILLESEFVQSVPRLVAADLVGTDPAADRYWPTAGGREMYAARMKGRGVFGWADAIPPALRHRGEPQDATWALAPGVFAAAVRDYGQQVR